MQSSNFFNLPNYDSPADLKDFLDFFCLGMQKKFGQNFLIDQKIRNGLVSFLNLKPNTTIWEIGPGLGAMSAIFLSHNCKLTAFEIDKGFVRILKKMFAHSGYLNLIEGDVLKTWQSELSQNGRPDIFFGNLPYNIATELILATIRNLVIFDKILITVQKEVAQKIVAKPSTKNSKDYCLLSVLCNWLYDCKIVKNIPSSCFWPQPHIESSAVFFTPKATLRKESNDFGCKNPELFIKIVKALFLSRRKTIKNNLSAWLRQNNYKDIAEKVLKQANINENLRAENLSRYDFLLLCDIIDSWESAN